MGRRAAQLLMKQINAGKADAEAIVGSVRLVVRESSMGGLNRDGRKIA
jgi:LacI family transcriptional regulator